MSNSSENMRAHTSSGSLLHAQQLVAGASERQAHSGEGRQRHRHCVLLAVTCVQVQLDQRHETLAQIAARVRRTLEMFIVAEEC